MKKLLSALAFCAVTLVAFSAGTRPAHAWWTYGGPRIGFVLPRLVVHPPVIYPAPIYPPRAYVVPGYAPPVVYAPPPAIAYAPPRIWVPGGWVRGVWVPPHWG